jgi:hypothetical protein
MSMSPKKVPVLGDGRSCAEGEDKRTKIGESSLFIRISSLSTINKSSIVFLLELLGINDSEDTKSTSGLDLKL